MTEKEIINNFVDFLKENGIENYILTFDSGANFHNNESSRIILKDEAVYCLCYNRDYTKSAESVFDFWVGNYDVVNTCAAYGLNFDQGLKALRGLDIDIESLSDDDPMKKFILNMPRRRVFVPTKSTLGPVTKEVTEVDEEGKPVTKTVNTIPKGSSGYVV